MNDKEKINKVIKEIQKRYVLFFEQKMFYLDYNFFKEAHTSEVVMHELNRICNILRDEFKN